MNEKSIEIKYKENEINKLNNLLDQYKTKTNKLQLELNQISKDKDDQIESLNFKVNLQNKQIIELSTQLSIKKKQLIEIQSKLDVKTHNSENLMKNNEFLSKEKMMLAKEHNEIQNQLLALTNLINIREKEMEENIENIKRENDPDLINEELQQLKNLIKKRNSECDNLNNNLNICMEEKKF